MGSAGQWFISIGTCILAWCCFIFDFGGVFPINKSFLALYHKILNLILIAFIFLIDYFFCDFQEMLDIFMWCNVHA